MEKKLKIIGIISICLGLVATALCIIPWGIFFAILAGFLGLIVSTIYIYLDTKNQINSKRFTAGIIGMILSSTPILFMITIIILSKVNS